jgi:hypothetical protein
MLIGLVDTCVSQAEIARTLRVPTSSVSYSAVLNQPGNRNSGHESYGCRNCDINLKNLF